MLPSFSISSSRPAAWLVAIGLATAACTGGDGSTEATGDRPGPTAATTSAPPGTTPTPIVPAAETLPTTTVPPDQLGIPVEPAALAAALTEAERALRDPDVAADAAAAWGRRQQRLYRALPAEPEQADAVIALVDPAVADGVRLNLTARRALSSLVRSGPLSEVLPAWRIDPPLPVDELLGYYREAEAATGIGWEYLAAINLVETRMGRIDGLSTAGATGPMQFLPTTWEECCEGDPTVDRDAINGAAVYLVRRGGPDDMARALLGYNPSDEYVEAISAYAEVLRQDELAYRGYHAWEVYFLSAAGLVRMPVGYAEPEPVDATEWIAANPDALVAEPD